MNAKADIKNLYTSLDIKIVLDAYRIAMEIVNIEPDSQNFLTNSLHIIMENNIFKEPAGTFQSGDPDKKNSANGFAIKH